ncbi:MAG: ADP-ribosylation factor-like protein, partial [Candidatus Hodarchaeales archaeon]
MVLTNKIIGLAVLWDEQVGRPRIISEVPPLSLPERDSAAMEIYIATASLFGQDAHLSCIITEIPFFSISPDHIAKVAFESWIEKSETGENVNHFGFIAFIMDRNTALKLDSFLPLAIQCFLNDFKREKDSYNLTLAWNALFTYLHVNKSSTTSASPKFIKGSYYRIAIAGLKFAGKTAILQRLLTGKFIHNTPPTQGAECELFSRGNARFQVTDLGGQESFIHSLWQSFMLKANAMVYVVDSSDEDTLVKSREILNLAVSWNSEVKVLLVLANKQDIEGAMDKETLNDFLDLNNMVIGTGIESYRIVDTSARTGLNIQEAFSWLATQLTG